MISKPSTRPKKLTKSTAAKKEANESYVDERCKLRWDSAGSNKKPGGTDQKHARSSDTLFASPAERESAILARALT